MLNKLLLGSASIERYIAIGKMVFNIAKSGFLAFDLSKHLTHSYLLIPPVSSISSLTFSTSKMQFCTWKYTLLHITSSHELVIAIKGII